MEKSPFFHLSPCGCSSPCSPWRHRRRETSSTTSSTGRSALKNAPACRTGSGGCCRSCSLTSCRTGRERAGKSSGSSTNRADAIARSGRPNAGGAIKLAGLNCATCHTGTLSRNTGGGSPVVLGMPANQMDLQSYLRFLTACAQDPRFTAANLIAAIEKVNPKVGFFEKLVYRLVVIGRTRSGILDRTKENGVVRQASAAGAGPRRYVQSLQGPLRVRHERRRERRHCRSAVALESAAAARAVAALGRQQRSRRRAQQERGDRRRRDPGLARRGRARADRRMDSRSEAAGVSAPRASMRRAPPRRRPSTAASARRVTTSGRREVGQVTPLDEIATDPERLNSFTKELAAKMNTLGEGKPWQLLALPQDERLRQHAARWPVAPRAVSPQRFGADAARAALPGDQADTVLSRLRRVRLGTTSGSSAMALTPLEKASPSIPG